MGFVQWVFNKLISNKIKNDKGIMKTFKKLDKSNLSLINSVEDMMKEGSPIPESVARNIGVVNWETHDDNDKGYVEVPLKVKYDYVWDVKMKLFVPRDESKRPKHFYTKGQIKSKQDFGETMDFLAANKPKGTLK